MQKITTNLKVGEFNIVNSSIETLNPTQAKLTVEVTYEELAPNIAKAYKSISEKMQVPGFRKGKVPAKIIDQRVGRGAVIEQAVRDGLDGFYRKALQESGLHPLMQPEVDITSVPDPVSNAGNLVFVVEIEKRPEIVLPEYDKLELTVSSISVTEEEENQELDQLRARFGSLLTVERPAAVDDFVSMDLLAKVAGEEVDSSKGVSYQIGTNNMLDGLDEALTGLSASETTIFATTLAGGSHAGKEAEVEVKLLAVKERELPEANDEFAQMASEFDTLEKLREALGKQVIENKKHKQILEAREKAVEFSLEKTEIPLSEKYVESEVANRLKQLEKTAEEPETAAEDSETKIRTQAEKDFRTQVLLDTLVNKFDIKVDQQEIINYIVSSASQYGMSANDFAKAIDEAGQIPVVMTEISRGKAVLQILSTAKVVDENGKEIDFSQLEKDSSAETENEVPVAEENDSDLQSLDDPGAVRI